MKIKVTDLILDYDGKEYMEYDEKRVLTTVPFRQMWHAALNRAVEGETLTTEQADKCFEITSKLYESSEVNLTTTQAAYIIERVKKVYSGVPLFIGRTKQKLDGEIEIVDPAKTEIDAANAAAKVAAAPVLDPTKV